MSLDTAKLGGRQVDADAGHLHEEEARHRVEEGKAARDEAKTPQLTGERRGVEEGKVATNGGRSQGDNARAEQKEEPAQIARANAAVSIHAVMIEALCKTMQVALVT